MRFSNLFPTVVAESFFPGMAEFNRFLLKYAENDQKLSGLTNGLMVEGGRQSDFDLLASDNTLVSEFRVFLFEQLKAYFVRALPGIPVEVSRITINSWVVELSEGGFQHQHVHPGASIVGVYYASIPCGPTGTLGDICFVDPREGHLASRLALELDGILVSPEVGKLLLFPGFLPHRVEKVRSPGKRLSLNFDVRIR